MRAALILSGGSGRRFESALPKQYHTLNGKMAIAYVLEAALGAPGIDRVVIAGTACAQLDALRAQYPFLPAPGGARRNETLANGLEALSPLHCAGVVVLDAVRPLVTSGQIARYLGYLAEGYDAVTTAQPITDSLGCYDLRTVDRSRYYLMQSPEAFAFGLLHRHFDRRSPLTEVIHQLPGEARVKLCFDYPHNPKLTYPWDRAYLEHALKNRAEDARAGFTP